MAGIGKDAAASADQAADRRAEPAEASLHPATQPLADTQHTLSGHRLAAVDPGAGPQPGMMLGPYKLLRPLGEGGMGQVWVALQTQPLKREVAVKLLSRRLDDRIGEAWFLVERQALAMLLHPCIAQIYDAGQLPGGLMFFAMELVEGSTLDVWVRRDAPTLTQLTGLFEQICQGIQHAHQRGLIHRDLKPSNLLVSTQDGQILPKIIDFGVAIGGIPGQAAAPAQGAVGTRAYMAPEQARPGAGGIDARADVYALGATLAALLCLRAGIRADGLQALSHFRLTERASAVNAEVAPPSERSTQDERVRRLRREVPRALRAILLKATASEREQRYESAAALGEDLRRWRSGEPVAAVGGGSGYALRCFLRRHAWASAAAVLAVLALLGGSGMALYGLGQARQAQALAEQRRLQAEDLVGVMLGDLADKLRPLGRLDLLETVGAEAMRYLSAAGSSDGAGAVQRARALRTLGEVHVQRQQLTQAEAAFSEAARTLAQAPAGEDAVTLAFERGQAAYWLGSLAYMAGNMAPARQHFDAYLQQAQTLRQLQPDSALAAKEYGYALSNLAMLDAREGREASALARYDEAIALLSATLRATPEDHALAQELSNLISHLASQLEAAGQPQAAYQRYLSQLQMLEQLPDTDAQARFRRALALHFLARLGALLGHAEAADQIAAAITLLSGIVALEPTHERWRLALLSAQLQGAEVAIVNRDPDSAIAQLIDMRRRVSDDEAALGARERALALRSALRLCVLLAADGQRSAALQIWQQALDHARQWDAAVLNDTARRDLVVLVLLANQLGQSNELAAIDAALLTALRQPMEQPRSATALERDLALAWLDGEKGLEQQAMASIEQLGYAPHAFLALLGRAADAALPVAP